LKSEAGDTTKRFTVANDLLYYFFGVADEQRALRGSLRIEVSTGDGRPSALLRDSGDGAGVAWEEVIDGFLCRACYIARECTPTLSRSGEYPNRLPVSR